MKMKNIRNSSYFDDIFISGLVLCLNFHWIYSQPLVGLLFKGTRLPSSLLSLHSSLTNNFAPPLCLTLNMHAKFCNYMYTRGGLFWGV